MTATIPHGRGVVVGGVDSLPLRVDSRELYPVVLEQGFTLVSRGPLVGLRLGERGHLPAAPDRVCKHSTFFYFASEGSSCNTLPPPPPLKQRYRSFFRCDIQFTCGFDEMRWDGLKSFRTPLITYLMRG